MIESLESFSYKYIHIGWTGKEYAITQYVTFPLFNIKVGIMR